VAAHKPSAPGSAITRSQARLIDQRAIKDYGMSGLVLMENAARGCVDFLVSRRVAGPVLVACGKGNNGGDGFAMARLLDNRGIQVRLLLCADPASLTGDALDNFKIASLCGIHVTVALTPDDIAASFDSAGMQPEWVVDALLGTGASGAPRGAIPPALNPLNAAAGSKLAIDIPSGLDCDTGQAPGELFRADHTCTFVAAKPGLLNPATPCAGDIHVVNIGAPRKLVEEIMAMPAADSTG